MNTKAQKGKTRGQPGEKFTEKKEADSPKFVRKNERQGDQLEAEGFPKGTFTRHLWNDPPHPNEARAQVKGSGEVGFESQGLRNGEEEHGDEPSLTHYGHDAGEIQEHQDAIIDKHSETSAIYRHRVRSKESYALAPESRSITKNYRGANGPSGNPQARKN